MIKRHFFPWNSLSLYFWIASNVVIPLADQQSLGMSGATEHAWPGHTQPEVSGLHVTFPSYLQPLSNILLKNCFQKVQQKTPFNHISPLKFSHNSLKTQSKKTTRQWHLFQHFWIIQGETENERLLITVKEIGESDTY